MHHLTDHHYTRWAQNELDRTGVLPVDLASVFIDEGYDLEATEQALLTTPKGQHLTDMASTTKRHYIPGVTPGFGVLVYPKLVHPDTRGEYADGKFKTDLVLKDKKDAEAFYRFLQKQAKEIFGTTDVMMPVKKTKTGKIVKDEDGNIVFRFKSKKRPVLVDAKRKRLPQGVDVRGGTVGRISYTLTNYKDGLSLWVDAVQIVDLVSGSPGASAFDETDGFDAGDLDESDFADDSDFGNNDDSNDPPFDEGEDGDSRFDL